MCACKGLESLCRKLFALIVINFDDYIHVFPLVSCQSFFLETFGFTNNTHNHITSHNYNYISKGSVSHINCVCNHWRGLSHSDNYCLLPSCVTSSNSSWATTTSASSDSNITASCIPLSNLSPTIKGNSNYRWTQWMVTVRVQYVTYFEKPGNWRVQNTTTEVV